MGTPLQRIVSLGDPNGTVLLTEEGTLVEGVILGDGEARQGPKGLTSVHTGNEFDVTGTPAGTSLTRGEEYTLRLTSGGEVLTSGTDNLGGMGIKTDTRVKDRERGLEQPTAIPGLENIAAIDTGENHSIALTELGMVFQWGVPTMKEITGNKHHRPRLMEFPGQKSVAQVFFGNAEAPGFSIDREGSITAITPPHDPGEIDLRIVFEDGSETILDDAFAYTE